MLKAQLGRASRPTLFPLLSLPMYPFLLCNIYACRERMTRIPPGLRPVLLLSLSSHVDAPRAAGQRGHGLLLALLHQALSHLLRVSAAPRRSCGIGRMGAGAPAIRCRCCCNNSGPKSLRRRVGDAVCGGGSSGCSSSRGGSCRERCGSVESSTGGGKRRASSRACSNADGELGGGVNAGAAGRRVDPRFRWAAGCIGEQQWEAGDGACGQ